MIEFRKVLKTYNRGSGNAFFLMREIWNFSNTTPNPTVNWNVVGRRLRRCVAANPGTSLQQMALSSASFWAMSALTKS